MATLDAGCYELKPVDCVIFCLSDSISLDPARRLPGVLFAVVVKDEDLAAALARFSKASAWLLIPIRGSPLIWLPSSLPSLSLSSAA